MKKLFFAAVICLINFAVCMADAYESVPNDPMKSRIYTLDNGLKIYLTDNKDLPRIQTYIAVRVGGKNDPAETTGLSHYLEHLMFKGTKQYGTSDYSKEKPKYGYGLWVVGFGLMPTQKISQIHEGNWKLWKLWKLFNQN